MVGSKILIKNTIEFKINSELNKKMMRATF